ncbi:uncharacterized protein LOC141621520 [Silene latifolia]|uniref:uncharacterized protein LOC141621520 n=1 Tax=Silene latifolia TaxID=37657 RepID=UPI003D76C5A8
MTTSQSTVIIHSPVGDKAVALATWMASHQMALTKLQNMVFCVKMPLPGQKAVNISSLRSKKAKTTLQEEKHWLDVTIPNVELYKVNAYMGCSHCGKRSKIPPEQTYTCTSSSQANYTSAPKITFNCDISDGTETLPMTALHPTEKLFKMSAADVFHMKHSGDDQAFLAVKVMLFLTPFKVQVSLATSLSASNILQWAVKQVIMDDTSDNASGSVSATQENTPGSHIEGSSLGSHVQSNKSCAPSPNIINTTPMNSVSAATSKAQTDATNSVSESAPYAQPEAAKSAVNNPLETTNAILMQQQPLKKDLRGKKVFAASAALPSK